MRDLQRALVDIQDIRRQVAQSSEFRGYGPLTLCGTAAFALAGGAVQAIWLPRPAIDPLRYVALWGVVAILSATLIAVQTLTRTHRLHSGMADEMIRMAAEQFLPALVAGSLLTLVLVRLAAPAAWLLPGLWQIIYSLGIFSSCRFLPRPMLAAGAWYLVAGLLVVSLGDERALAPAWMAGVYGGGQFLIAAILHLAAKEPAGAG